MLDCFDFIREMTLTGVAIRMTLAFICGGLVGLEREFKRRPAGFRTHILICLGAAMTTLTSQYLYLTMNMFTDVSRMGAQVIAGIGFIGAGAIIVTKQRRVKGLTTAAGLWTSAIIGLACGAGYVECAVFATLLVLLAELLLIKLEYRVAAGSGEINLYVEYGESQCVHEILRLLREAQIRITDLEISRAQEEPGRFCAVISFQSMKSAARERMINRIAALERVIKVEEL